MLVLASNSPRRKQLLDLGGWPFRVQPAEIDERPRPGEAPDNYVLRLAESKARAIAPHVEPGAVVIAADTTVADGMLILGKPLDAHQAEEMLTQLRGRTHRVYTAIAVLRAPAGSPLTDLGVTDVPMREYTDEEIFAYVASGDPLDKAGAYAIQHAGFHPVENLTGCFANVMGLPLCHLVRTLRKLGVSPQTSVPQACQDMFSYACPVHAQILMG